MKSIFELFIKQKIEFRFVLFSIGQTLVQKLRRNDFDASLKITRLQLFHQLSSFLHYLCKLGLANQQGIRILLVPSGSLSNIVSTQPLIRILYFYNKRQPAQFDLSDGVLRTRPEIYIQSAPNNSNETYTFMCLGRAGHFGQY